MLWARSIQFSITMNRFRKTKYLKTSPDPVATAAFNNWLATFQTFPRTAEADQATTNPGVEVKKGLLVDFLSHVVYSYVEDCETLR